LKTQQFKDRRRKGEEKAEARLLKSLRWARYRLQLQRLFHPKLYHIKSKRLSHKLRLTRRSLIAVTAVLIISIGYFAIAGAMPISKAIKAVEMLFTFGSTSTITVTNTPLFGLEAPTQLTVTYITDSDVRVTWTIGNMAVNTEIVANYNHYPTSRTDGYVLYDSTGTYVDDLSVNLNEYWGTYYVSGWSQDVDGYWTTDYSSAKYEVDMTALVAEMQQWLLFALLVALNALVFWKVDKHKFFWVIGAIIDITSGLLFAATAVQWTMTWVLGFMIAIVGLACLTYFMLWSFRLLRGKTQRRDEDEDDD
jgi:hypothetical protein